MIIFYFIIYSDKFSRKIIICLFFVFNLSSAYLSSNIIHIYIIYIYILLEKYDDILINKYT